MKSKRREIRPKRHRENLGAKVATYADSLVGESPVRVGESFDLMIKNPAPLAAAPTVPSGISGIVNIKQ
jgi:hypothetical protein